ncbi:MAG TPA: nitrite/sulfite reductase [Thermodesulfobacteriota bacterium]|nr:nitrite/sulfite reductase [Thermodesulfobacteriota bacterium]
MASVPKIELIKKAKNPLDILEDIRRYAQLGHASIDPDDLEGRFRWFGLYTQRPPEEGFFMLRIKIPGGQLTAEQLERVALIAERYGRGLLDITDRQNVQFHWVRIEHVPTIFDLLAEVGITTLGACGDTVRNIIGCPMAGIDAEEILDAGPVVRAATAHFVGNKAFSDLPRKYKISIAGCRHQCTHPEINDVALVGVIHDGVPGFDLWVGGGLGTVPRFAQRLGAFVRPEEAVEVLHHVTAVYRDHGCRTNRLKARIKFLIADWGPARFREAVEASLGRKLTDGPPAPAATDPLRDHVGVTPQHTPGLYAVGAATLRGRMEAAQARAVAELARTHASGRLRTTTLQNLIVLDVPEGRVDAVVRGLEAQGLAVHRRAYRARTMACTGIQFCKLAVAETKEKAREIVLHLEQALPDLDEPININVTGCPNSCTRYQLADIGLLGSQVKVPGGEPQPAYQVYLGGRGGEGRRFGRHLKRRVLADELAGYIERVIRQYLAERRPGERFGDYVGRLDAAALEQLGVQGPEPALEVLTPGGADAPTDGPIPMAAAAAGGRAHDDIGE